MYGLRRRKTHGELVRVELGESLDHLKQAAAHAAGGVGENVGPRVAAVRVYANPANIKSAASHGWESTVAAFAPLAAAAKDGAMQARRAKERQMKKLKKELSMSRSKPSRRRWPVLVGLLAAGAAVGAASAAIMRRRRKMQWDEYETSRTLEAMDSAHGSFDRTMDKASSGVDKAMDAAARGTEKAAEKTTSTVHKAGDKVSSALGTAKDKTETATDTAKRQADRAHETTEELISRSGSPSKNSRS